MYLAEDLNEGDGTYGKLPHTGLLCSMAVLLYGSLVLIEAAIGFIMNYYNQSLCYVIH